MCKGESGRSGEKRLCRFSNVCYDRKDQKLLFYTNPAGQLPLVFDNGIVEDFGDHFLNQRGGCSNVPDYLKIEKLKHPLPQEHANAFSNATISVLLKPFWAENFGHFLVDDLFSVFSGLSLLSLLTPDAALVLPGKGCAEIHGGSELTRCEKFFEQWSRGLSRRAVLRLSDDMTFPYQMACFDTLVVGVGALCFHGGTLGRGSDFWMFRKWMLLNMGIADSPSKLCASPPCKSVITILKKKESIHPRDIINFDAMVAHLTAKFSHIAELQVFAPHVATAKEQIEQALKTTVAITPEGGISFWAFFLPVGSVAIFIDHWDEGAQASVHMEGYFWTNMPWLHDFYYTVKRNEV